MERRADWLGFLGFLGFDGFQAFSTHNPWVLFVLCFFSFFACFEKPTLAIRSLGIATGIAGFLLALLAVTGVVRI